MNMCSRYINNRTNVWGRVLMNNCIVYARYESKSFLPLSQQIERKDRFKQRWTVRTLFLTVLVAISFFFGFLVQANATGKDDQAVVSLDSAEASIYEQLAGYDSYTNVSNISSSTLSRPTIIDVAPGDSLWSIANEYANGQSVRSFIRDIQRLNELDSTVLQVGQILHLPSGD